MARSIDTVTVNAAQLVPANHGYYTFSGSLTTPPCTENVTWFVLKSPPTISAGELDTFAGVYPLNARPIQALNARTVLETK